MKRIFDDLWQTKLEIPFGSVHAHAYFLQRENGNALVYNTSHATLFRSRTGWETLVIASDGGSTESLLESLEFYRTLSPDVVLWSASNRGDLSYIEPTGVEWKAIVDRVIDSVTGVKHASLGW